jgi:hypothetical protein
MSERWGYRTALFLSALIAVVHGIFLIYTLSNFPSLGESVAIYFLVAVAVSVGLWLQSRIARNLGAVLYFLFAGAAAFPFLGFGGTPGISVNTLWVVAMGILSLAVASILVFSKPFAREFAVELEKRPPYKKRLLKAYAVLIVLAVGAAILIDFVNLASK